MSKNKKNWKRLIQDVFDSRLTLLRFIENGKSLNQLLNKTYSIFSLTQKIRNYIYSNFQENL